jgi:serine/arginine repetitive matrix protein 2
LPSSVFSSELTFSSLELKELQNTYNTLVVKVQTLLDTQPQPSQPVEKPLPPVPSPNFFAQLKSRPKSRTRSNTVGSTPDIADSDVVPSSQVAYKTLEEAFWSLNSKYKVSWEYAELLIELGSGSGGDGSGGGGMMSSPSSAAMTSVSAPVIHGGEGNMFNSKARERAIMLVGDDSTTLPPTVHNEAQTRSQSQPSSASITGSSSMPGGIPSGNATSSSGPPLASSSGMSWRASTGRHDLSQRQLVLLREMLNNNVGASIVGASDNEGGLRLPPPPPPFSIPAEDPQLCPSGSSPYPSSRSQFVNRDWRWGDARNSTITLSEEQESGFGIEEEGARGDGKMEMEKEKKRRSGRLGMSGIRDMLRSFRKGHAEESHPRSGEVQLGQQYHHHLHSRLPAPVMHSTTSLSTESSIGHNQAQAQAQQQRGRLPIPRIPSQIRRRPRASTGPESMKSNKGLPPTPFSPSSFVIPKSSPRRPSLASIFRIGNNRPKPTVLPAVDAGVEDAISPSGFSASEHDLSRAQRSSGTTGTGGEENNSTGEEEEDWDRMDSPSDIDAAAAKALGIVDGAAYDVSATVRGRVKTKAEETKKAGVSPYPSSYENDPPPVPSLPASSSSTGLGNFLARHSIIPKRSFSASQVSIVGSREGDGPRNILSRLSRHSNFEEQQQAMETTSVEPAVSLHMSSSKSAPTTSQSKVVSNVKNTGGGTSSRPSSSRSTKFPNTKSGSVRSMLPTSSSLGPLPDPKVGMIMTAENIKPLLENAKEVHLKLHECIVEIRALIENGTAGIGHTGVGQVVDPAF